MRFEIGAFGRWLLLFILLVGYLFSLSSQVARIEGELGLQQLFAARGHVKPPTDIVIVAISKDISERLDYPPEVVRWSRVAHARLIDALTEGGAALVVMDIAFKESRPSEDKLLGQSIKRAGNVLLYKYVKRTRESSPFNDGGVLDTEQQILPPEVLLRNALGAFSLTLPKMGSAVTKARIYNDFGSGDELTQPLAAFIEHHQQAVSALYPLIVTKQELDDSPLGLPLGSKTLHHKALVLRQALLLDDKLSGQIENSLEKHIPDPLLRQNISRVLKVLQHDRWLNINFFGPNRTLSVVPMDAFFSSVSVPDVKNKIVLVGVSETTQTEQVDVHHTVYRSFDGLDVSGVEVSATILANLMREDSLQFMASSQRAFLAALCVALSVLTFLSLRPVFAVTVQLLVCLVYFQTALWFFNNHFVWLPLVLPLLILIITNVAVLYLRYRSSRKQHKYVLNAFSHFLPYDVAKQLSQDVIALETQHKLVQGVCLMTDLQGYTGASETMPPQELHQKLNQYYEQLIDIVNDNGGTVANIVGDSLLAIWTSSVLDEEVCRKAYKAAQAMMLQNDRIEDNGIQLTTSIALHGGEFSLGNLGGRDHFEFSPVGDIVNTTSRIEHFNRDLGTELLCSATICALLPNTGMRYLGEFSFKNKFVLTPLYEGFFESTFDSRNALNERNQNFQLALDKFNNNNWQDALSLFKSFLTKYPNDGPATFYVKQCRLKTPEIENTLV